MHTQKHTDTETGKHTYAHIQMQTHRQTNGHTNTQTHSNKTGGYRTTKTDRQIHRQTQTVTQRDTKTHRKTDRRVGCVLLWGHSRKSVPCDNGILECSSLPTSTADRADCTRGRTDPGDSRRSRRPGCSTRPHTSEGIPCHTLLRSNLTIN